MASEIRRKRRGAVVRDVRWALAAGAAAVALILLVVVSRWLVTRDENGVSVSDCVEVRVAYGQPRETAQSDCVGAIKK
jgi:hypothetical protein